MTALDGKKAGVDVRHIIYFILFVIGVAILSFAFLQIIVFPFSSAENLPLNFCLYEKSW